jgi:hypothetical protein
MHLSCNIHSDEHHISRGGDFNTYGKCSAGVSFNSSAYLGCVDVKRLRCGISQCISTSTFPTPDSTRYKHFFPSPCQNLLLIDENSCHTLFISDSPFQKLGSRDEGDYGRKIEKMRKASSREEKERKRLTIPEPIHILVTKIFFFSLLASDRAVATCLAPVHPRGWPKAIAPPTGFTYSSAIAVNGMEKGGRTFS